MAYPLMTGFAFAGLECCKMSRFVAVANAVADVAMSPMRHDRAMIISASISGCRLAREGGELGSRQGSLETLIRRCPATVVEQESLA
jgi:hypothetical protein